MRRRVDPAVLTDQREWRHSHAICDDGGHGAVLQLAHAEAQDQPRHSWQLDELEVAVAL